MAGECAVLDLVQVSTGKVVEARLEGVSQEELNQDDVGVFFGLGELRTLWYFCHETFPLRFINEAAKKDSSLPCTDCNGIRFEPPAQGRPPHEAIVSRLVVYSELIEVLIENDCMIKEKDKEVLHHTEETDSPGSFFSVIKGHLLDVLKYFFSFEKVMQCKFSFGALSQWSCVKVINYLTTMKCSNSNNKNNKQTNVEPHPK